MNKIRDNLYLGDKHDVRYASLKASGITAILNVTKEVPNPNYRDMECVKIAMHDSAESALATDEVATQALNRLLDSGHKVLVHCRQGKSRSPHIVAKCISKRENISYFDAYEEVRKLRPVVLEMSLGEEIRTKFGIEP